MAAEQAGALEVEERLDEALELAVLALEEGLEQLFEERGEVPGAASPAVAQRMLREAADQAFDVIVSHVRVQQAAAAAIHVREVNVDAVRERVRERYAGGRRELHTHDLRELLLDIIGATDMAQQVRHPPQHQAHHIQADQPEQRWNHLQDEEEDVDAEDGHSTASGGRSKAVGRGVRRRGPHASAATMHSEDQPEAGREPRVETEQSFNRNGAGTDADVQAAQQLDSDIRAKLETRSTAQAATVASSVQQATASSSAGSGQTVDLPQSLAMPNADTAVEFSASSSSSSASSSMIGGGGSAAMARSAPNPALNPEAHSVSQVQPPPPPAPGAGAGESGAVLQESAIMDADAATTTGEAGEPAHFKFGQAQQAQGPGSVEGPQQLQANLVEGGEPEVEPVVADDDAVSGSTDTDGLQQQQQQQQHSGGFRHEHGQRHSRQRGRRHVLQQDQPAPARPKPIRFDKDASESQKSTTATTTTTKAMEAAVRKPHFLEAAIAGAAGAGAAAAAFSYSDNGGKLLPAAGDGIRTAGAAFNYSVVAACENLAIALMITIAVRMLTTLITYRMSPSSSGHPCGMCDVARHVVGKGFDLRAIAQDSVFFGLSRVSVVLSPHLIAVANCAHGIVERVRAYWAEYGGLDKDDAQRRNAAFKLTEQNAAQAVSAVSSLGGAKLGAIGAATIVPAGASASSVWVATAIVGAGAVVGAIGMSGIVEGYGIRAACSGSFVSLWLGPHPLTQASKRLAIQLGPETTNRRQVRRAYRRALLKVHGNSVAGQKLTKEEQHRFSLEIMAAYETVCFFRPDLAAE